MQVWSDGSFVLQLTADDAADGDRYGSTVAYNGDLVGTGAPFNWFEGATAGRGYLYS